MMIRVMYCDGRFDLVKQDTLDQLLEKNRVEQLQASEGLIRKQDELEQKLNELTRKGTSDESTAGGRGAPQFYEDRPPV